VELLLNGSKGELFVEYVKPFMLTFNFNHSSSGIRCCADTRGADKKTTIPMVITSVIIFPVLMCPPYLQAV
jgi:hypothetical protein